MMDSLLCCIYNEARNGRKKKKLFHTIVSHYWCNQLICNWLHHVSCGAGGVSWRFPLRLTCSGSKSFIAKRCCLFLFSQIWGQVLICVHKKSHSYGVAFWSEWSRRGSNPRPNDEFSSFLHAYSSVIFRSRHGQEHPKPKLRYWISHLLSTIANTSLMGWTFGWQID